jgi:hypothetical protein
LFLPALSACACAVVSTTPALNNFHPASQQQNMNSNRQIESNQNPVRVIIGELRDARNQRQAAASDLRTSNRSDPRAIVKRAQTASRQSKKTVLFTPIPTEIDPIEQKQTHFPELSR